MNHLAIDIGNTRIKAGLFSSEKMLKIFDDLELEGLAGIISGEEVEKVIVSSVAYDLSDFERHLKFDQVLKFTHSLEIPVKNRYKTPETLGMDRLAAAIGASSLYPGSDCLVIDAGTTITYDFVDRDSNYQGGSISPGISIRLRSLNQHTSRLPLIDGTVEDIPLIGHDTSGSILSGVMNGIQAEIEGIIRRYEHKFPTLKVILCGGDAGIFKSKLKAHIFVVPHLVLIGLNSVLLYHDQNK